MPAPFLSVIIPTRNRADLLSRALHSLLTQTMARERFEVLVVDNGSSDHTREIARGMGKQLSNLHYFFTALPGLHAARHCGMKKAQGDVLAFIDDDVEAQPTWLEGIADGFSRPGVAMVGGKCLPKFACAPPRWLRQRWSQPVGPGYFWGIFSILDFGEAMKEIPPTFVIGCNFSIRKQALRAAGGFHPDSMPPERFLYRGDGETWVGKAVAAQGGKALYHPKATVVHFVPASRMTYDYVYSRAFAEGITRSFVNLRKTIDRDHALPDEQPPAQSRRQRFLNGLQRMAMALPLRHRVQKLEKKGLRDGFRCHQEHFARDPELRAWVLRPDWLDNPAGADPAQEMPEKKPRAHEEKPRRERMDHPSAAGEPGICRCPKCQGGLARKPDGLVCGMCACSFAQAEGYYDFFLDDRALAKTEYPPALEHLYFSAEKILALKSPQGNRFLDLFFRRHVFNNWWASELAYLKKTVQRYGTSEKRRVEFMVDDRASENFIRQKKNTAAKARNILKTISALPHTGNRVLHVGCGGECNEALPAAYQKAGFVNFGVDAVRSYVKEFGAFGEAHLANASALPYAAAVFDVVNYTDILEHLFDPLRGLQEASRVLKKGGFLVLETPNRSYLQRKNPLSWIEYGLVSLFPGLLRPRVITAAWEGEVLFHTEFSKREIMALLSHCGLMPVLTRTEVLRLSSPESAGSMLKRWAVLGLERIAPTNKWIIVARKT